MSSKMTFYVLKRILLAILTVWIVITLTFFGPNRPRSGRSLIVRLRHHKQRVLESNAAF